MILSFLPRHTWLLVLGVVLSAACATTPGTARESEPVPRGTDELPGTAGIAFRPYTGRFAADARLPGLRDRFRAAGRRALQAAEDDAGLAFLPGRGPLIAFVDASADAPATQVSVRLVEGVRRPLVRMAIEPLLRGTLTAEEHGAVALVEAALLASFGEREPPVWVRAGVPVDVAGALPRLLHERLLGGAAVTLDPEALIPARGDDDPVTAALRVAALRRVGRGQRPLALYLAERIRGARDGRALAAVGVEDPDFLQAAFETERKKRNASVLSDPAVLALAAARVAGGPDGFEPELEETASRWVRADLELVRAQRSAAGGKPTEAAAVLDRLLDRPSDVIRLELALDLRARLASRLGESRAAAPEPARGAAPKTPAKPPAGQPPRAREDERPFAR